MVGDATRDAVCCGFIHMGNLGLSELLVIGIIALLVIGPRRLPEVARALGEAVRAFQEALKGPSKDDR